MEIQFLGATQTVTGSKYLLVSDKKVLIDCGLFQGLKELRLRNRDKFPVNPAEIDAVVLTHAHLDHIGYLPLLVKNGFKGKIYSTHFTFKLAKVLLLDSAYIQEEEAARANRLGYSKHKPALPLYTTSDAEATFSHFQTVPFHENFHVGDLDFYFSCASHIFGAAFLLVKSKQTSILFSGDLGRASDPCLLPPEDILAANYLVIESTYGDRLHAKTDPEKDLGEVIRRAVLRGGTVIIPSFAVGRTQNVLYYIDKLKRSGEIPNIPVFLDSPMAQSVTDIVIENIDEYMSDEEEWDKILRVATYVNTVDASKALDTSVYPKVIISASGMATGGRVLHHIKAFAGDERNLILFVGYQAAGTRGEALVNGKKEIKMFGEMVTVNAEVVTLDNVSAHADYQEMLDWLGKIKSSPYKVFITHGEIKAAQALQEKIQTTFNWPCVIPEYLQIESL